MRCLIMTIASTAALNAAPLVQTGFEEFPAGEIRTLEADSFAINAESGHAEIEAKHPRQGKHCLHLLGGRDRSVDFHFPELDIGGTVVMFPAERWTSRSPFSFRIQIPKGEGWQEVHNGDRVRVGRGYRNRVVFRLPEQPIHRLRFVCTSPPNSGLLIDDFTIERARPMTAQRITLAQNTTPILVRNRVNPLCRAIVEVDGHTDPLVLREVTLALPAAGDIAAVEVYGTGSEERLQGVGDRVLLGTVENPGAGTTSIACELPLSPGRNVIWLSARLHEKANLDGRIAGCIRSLRIGDQDIEPETPTPLAPKRLGTALRQAGDDGVKCYRIPGLATSKQGTLIAVYDIRYNGWSDLPARIDVGMSRSLGGGRTWEPMRTILTMGKPDEPGAMGNGVGDPAILVDRETGTLWVAALWSHGKRGVRGSQPGLSPDQTGQLILARSDDDGKTWSKPINITAQVKLPKWNLLLQGPGAGICLRDGTLVFAAQYWDESAQRLPHSTLISSRDHGQTWQVGTGATPDTTESQVVELTDGSLMLNMRDNRGRSGNGFRAVATTSDLGQTWRAHPTSGKALPEPVCMASLIRVRPASAAYPAGILAFSNPARGKPPRQEMTIKLSFDDGQTWPAANQLLLDALPGAGYSCLTVIDERALGIVYEGSQAHLVFQRISLTALGVGD